MKLFFFFIYLFTFLGCEDIILQDDNQTADTLVEGDAYLPAIKKGVGPSVKLADYLYPNALTTNKNYIFNKVYRYTQNSVNVFDKKPYVFQRSFSKADNGSFVTVTEIKNKKEVNHFDVYPEKIVTHEFTLPLDLPAKVAKNDRVYEVYDKDVTKRCVVRYLGAKNLEDVLPLSVKNDLKNTLEVENKDFVLAQFNFESVMHIYCGTTTHHTTDSYYSNKYGRVVNIQKDIDKNMINVEVVDVLSEIN